MCVRVCVIKNNKVYKSILKEKCKTDQGLNQDEIIWECRCGHLQPRKRGLRIKSPLLVHELCLADF